MSGDNRTPGEEHFPQPAQLDAAGLAAQKRRNLWLGLALLAFVLLVGLTTIIRLSGSEGNQAEFYYNMNQTGQENTPALPPGITPEQAAPPPNLTAEPVPPDEMDEEERAPEQ